MTTDKTHRKVSLIEQITLRLINGFDISQEDIAEAEALDISIEAIAHKVGACYESGEE